jgi:phospholipid/cholesterol/gamma-HCH transport system substrate-binding protein
MRLTNGNAHRAGIILVTAILVIVVAAVGINMSAGLPFNLSLGFPPSHDYVLSADFTDANGVTPGANVLMAGAQVGQVTGIRIDRNRAVVTMRISQKYGPLHRGTVAAIRYSTLLAQKYVELTPASGTAALPSGAIIPSNETVTPVDFDQVLSSLDARTRQQVQVLVQQLGGGITGEQAAINALLDHLAGLSEQSPPALDTFTARDPQLSSILRNLSVVSARLAASHQQLGGLVNQTSMVTETLARNDTSLDGLLVHLASVSQDTSATLKGNQANLRKTVNTLSPFLVRLTPQLSTTGGYLRQGAPTLKAEMTQLIPEVVSAISGQDAGGNYLRQYVVVNTCYDFMSKTRAKPKGNGQCLAQVSGLGGLTGAGGTGAGKRSQARCKQASASATPRPSASPSLPIPLPSSSASPCAKPRSGTMSPAPSPSPSSGGLLGSIFSFFGGGS